MASDTTPALIAAGPTRDTPVGDVDALIDGGDMDCGSGLLLMITRSMRRLADGQLLAIRSAEPSVADDLPVWADLVGHEVHARVATTSTGPWWFAVRKVTAVAASTWASRGSQVFAASAGCPAWRCEMPNSQVARWCPGCTDSACCTQPMACGSSLRSDDA